MLDAVNNFWDLHINTTRKVCEVFALFQLLILWHLRTKTNHTHNNWLLVNHWLSSHFSSMKRHCFIVLLRPKQGQFLPILQTNFSYCRRRLQTLHSSKQRHKAFPFFMALHQDVADLCVICSLNRPQMCSIQPTDDVKAFARHGAQRRSIRGSESSWKVPFRHT